jgi:hypothetical protein
VLSAHKPLVSNQASLLWWQVFSQYHYRDSCSGEEVGTCQEHCRRQLLQSCLNQPYVVWCCVAPDVTPRQQMRRALLDTSSDI